MSFSFYLDVVGLHVCVFVCVGVLIWSFCFLGLVSSVVLAVLSMLGRYGSHFQGEVVIPAVSVLVLS